MSGDGYQALLEEAARAFSEGHMDRARELIDQVLHESPDHPRALALLNRLFPSPWSGTASAAASSAPSEPPPAPTGGGSAFDSPIPGLEHLAHDAPGHEVAAAIGDAWGPPVDEVAVSDEVVSAAPGLALLGAGPPPPPPPAPPKPIPPPKRTPQEDVEHLMEGARELFDLGDFSGSLETVEQVLVLDPENGAALDYLEKNEATLCQMYESKIGDRSRVPTVRLDPDDIVWLTLDHRAGFVLAQIDGEVSYEDLFALSGMSRLDTCKIIVQLLEQDVIGAD